MKRIGALLVALVVVTILVAVYLIAGDRTASDLEVGQITEDWPEYPATAIAYALPRKTLILATATEITGCIETANGESLRGTTSLAISSSMSIDPAQQYYVYFESGSRAKNLDYSVEVYDNGALKAMSLFDQGSGGPDRRGGAGRLRQPRQTS